MMEIEETVTANNKQSISVLYCEEKIKYQNFTFSD